MFELFHEYAHRYDLHTPAGHYQHDHELVLALAREQGPQCRMLDVGCGTGVLVEKARRAGIDAVGIDSAPNMIAVARKRLPENSVRVQRMQDLGERERYDLVVSLSWSIHYCADAAELRETLRRIHSALVPGGALLLQVAHGANIVAEWVEDREPGPTGVPDDVVFRFRFRPDGEPPRRVYADYVYRCDSANEEFAETHVLEMTDVAEVSRMMGDLGFGEVEVWDSWRRDRFDAAGSALVCAHRPDLGRGSNL